MQALSDDIIRVLAFAYQAERGGGVATHDAVNAFFAQPRPPEPELPWVSAGLRAGLWAYEPGDVAQWLIDIGLAHDHPRVVSLTSLGLAMLDGAQVDSATALMLQPDDPLSYPQLVARLSGEDETLIADPYIRLYDLHQLLADTTVDRVLSSPRAGEAELRGMSALTARSTRKVDVRITDDNTWHDRYVITDDRVWQLGASVNGLHKNVTALLPVTDEVAATPMRAYVENLWSNAQDLLTLFADGSSPSPDESRSNGDDGEARSSP